MGGTANSCAAAIKVRPVSTEKITKAITSVATTRHRRDCEGSIGRPEFTVTTSGRITGGSQATATGIARRGGPVAATTASRRRTSQPAANPKQTKQDNHDEEDRVGGTRDPRRSLRAQSDWRGQVIQLRRDQGEIHGDRAPSEVENRAINNTETTTAEL